MSNDSKVTAFFKENDTECKMLIGKSEQEVKDFIAQYQTRFDSSINSKIYETFGEYLYNALGKKINSQIKNKLLQVYFDAHKSDFDVVDKDGKVTRTMNDKEIVEKLAHDNHRSSYWYRSKKEYAITHATVGRYFGMGYVTPGKQIRAISIPARFIFFYLTQEHVDLISNKQKRECAQDFLKFRDSFMKIRDDLAKDTVIKGLEIPTDMAIFKKIEVRNSIGDGYGSPKEKYLVHESTYTGKINTVEILMKNIGSAKGKDKISEVINTDSSNLRSHFKSGGYRDPHSIVISVFKEKEGNELCFYGSVQLQEKESLVPLNVDKIKDGNSVCWFSKDMTSTYYAKDWSPLGAKCSKLTNPKGFMLGWKDVLNNEKVATAIDQRIKFFESASKTLHYLKKKHAALVFIHGIF